MSYAILGGGISGLAAAFYLREFGCKSKIMLLEGSSRLGGWINSIKNESGSLFELGPRTLRVAGNAGANTLNLAEKLNLEDEIIPIPCDHVAAKQRMIKVGNMLHTLPNSLKSIMTRLPPFSKPLIFHLLKDLSAESVVNNDESFYSFAQRRFGSEIASFAVDPLCRGIFAGNAKDLSVKAIAKRLYNVEQKYQSVLKGMFLDREFNEKFDFDLICPLNERANRETWSVWSLRGGLQTLVKSLEENLVKNDVEIVTGLRVQEIKCENHKVVIITDKETYYVNKAISCLPANEVKDLVKNWNPNLYSLLSDIPFVNVGIVNLEYSGSLIKEAGFGYLVPSSEPSKVLGVIYDSCVFPIEGKTVFTVMMGGYWFKEYFGNNPSPDLFLEIALEEIRTTFNSTATPTNYKVSILENCIPQYTVGHFERVENARRLLSGHPLYLAGNSYDGAGINDAVYNTKKLVESLL